MTMDDFRLHVDSAEIEPFKDDLNIDKNNAWIKFYGLELEFWNTLAEVVNSKIEVVDDRRVPDVELIEFEELF